MKGRVGRFRWIVGRMSRQDFWSETGWERARANLRWLSAGRWNKGRGYGGRHGVWLGVRSLLLTISWPERTT